MKDNILMKYIKANFSYFLPWVLNPIIIYLYAVYGTTPNNWLLRLGILIVIAYGAILISKFITQLLKMRFNKAVSGGIAFYIVLFTYVFIYSFFFKQAGINKTTNTTLYTIYQYSFFVVMFVLSYMNFINYKKLK